MLGLVVVGIVIICFGGIIFFGAPYVPTHKKWIKIAVEIASKEGTLVDLGCGDGSVILEAVKRGNKVIGVELNPILVMVSKFRLRRFRQSSKVVMTNFWRFRLPNDTTTVFVFTAGPFISGIDRYMQSEANRLGSELTLISYGFSIPKRVLIKNIGPLMAYTFKPVTLQNSSDRLT